MSKVPWIRQLTVTLYNDKGYKLTFGERKKDGNMPLHISVKGTKYLSSLKDAFTVTIDNLTYSEIVQIVDAQLFNVIIKAGYLGTGTNEVFKGSVAYVSNKPGSDGTKTNQCILLCTSRLMARYGQSRMNLKINSGINLYSAFKFICQRAGVTNTYIDDNLKNRIAQEVLSVNTSLPNFIDAFTSDSTSFISDVDSSSGSDLSFWDVYNKSKRLVKLTSGTILLNGGYPKLTNDGLTFSVLPMFNLSSGDTVQLDNSLIDISVSNTDQITKNYAYYFDSNSQYILYQLDYSLDNKGGSFSVECLAKARSLFQSLTGSSA